jgi:hypothetical protein
VAPHPNTVHLGPSEHDSILFHLHELWSKRIKKADSPFSHTVAYLAYTFAFIYTSVSFLVDLS